jgi:hypothetical protein
MSKGWVASSGGSSSCSRTHAEESTITALAQIGLAGHLAADGQPYKTEVPSPAVVASVYRALHSLTRKGHLVVKNPTQRLVAGRIRPAAVWVLAEQHAKDLEREQKKQANKERERKQFEKLQQEERDRDGLGHLSPDVAKLAKMLGMLGSSSDNEVLAAARQIEALRQRLGVNWADLLDSFKVDIAVKHKQYEEKRASAMGPKMREKMSKMYPNLMR